MREESFSDMESDASSVWYVMTSPHPKSVEEHLSEENLRRRERGRLPFRYFVPYCFLRRRIAESTCEESYDESPYFNPKNRDEVSSHNELRSALRRYIFIRTSFKELESFLREGSVHDCYRSLWYYRDRSGHKVTVSSRVMEDFIRACCDRHLRFEVWPALDGIEANDEVFLNSGPFKGYKARVLSIRHDKSGCCHMTVGFHLFHGAMLLRLPDLRPEDVLYERKDSEGSVREANRYKMLEDIQRKLFAIMGHRMEPALSDRRKEKDLSTLSMLYNYRYHQFESATMRRKLSGLMLLCATLLGDVSGRSELTSEVIRELRAMDSVPSGKVAHDVRAFLYSCLYLSTRNPEYKEEALSYYRSHPHPSATHRQWMKYLTAPV